MVDSTIALMREVVDIEDSTAVADGSGGQTITWAATYSNVSAQVKPVRGNETEVMGREATVQTYLVKIRNGHTITTRSRLKWGSEYLNIRSIENRDMRRRFVTMECELGRGT